MLKKLISHKVEVEEMQIKNLYKYNRADGGTTISPVKPDCDYIEMYRIIADEDKVVTKDGINVFSCRDVSSTEGWYEIDAPEEEDNENISDTGGSSTSGGGTNTGVEFTEEDVEYAKAGRILLGVEE
jgi:hypothetical protein